MASDNSVFWILVVVAVVLAAYFICNSQNRGSLIETIKQNLGLNRKFGGAPQQAPVFQTRQSRQRTHMLEVEHNDPLLVTLFTRDATAIPDGMTTDQFDKLVTEYQEKHLTSKPVEIPRSLHFNYDKYAAEQEEMNKAISRHYQQFTDREEVGTVSERVIRPSGPGVTLQARTFKKKVNKR